MRPLSRRERQVYELTRAGRSAAAIAAELGVTRGTVYVLRHRVAEKIGLSRALRRLEGMSGASALRL